MTVKLQVFLRDAGIGSRRYTCQLIKEGKIILNGKIASMGDVVNPETDTVKYNNQLVKVSKDNIYIALYKPQGYTSTNKDRFAEKTVFDLLPPQYKNYFIVGRLDKNSEGLMIITNDGNLVQQITHPKFRIEKTYLVHINRAINSQDIEKIKRGKIDLGDFTTQPIKIKIKNNPKIVEMTLTEGKKREIRRIFEKLGYKVVRLIRTQIMGLNVRLKPGEFLQISKENIQKKTD